MDMRNPQMTELNMQISRAKEILDWLQASARISGNITEMDNFSYANKHYRISSYTLYGDDQQTNSNRLLLTEIAQSYISFLARRKSAFVFSISCDKNRTAPIISINCDVSESVKHILTEIPDLSISEVEFSDAFPAGFNNSCLLCGWDVPTYEAIDSFLSANAHREYSIHIISRPVPQEDIEFECSEIERIISNLSQVQQIERYIGQQRIQQLSAQVEFTLSALRNYRDYCNSARHSGLWKTHIWIRALDKNSCFSLATDFAGRLSAISASNENFVFQRTKSEILVDCDCLTSNGWLIPRSKVAAAPYHSILNEILCDITTDDTLARLCSLPHQTHKNYYVRDASGGRWQKEPYSPYVRNDVSSTSLIELGYCGNATYDLNHSSIAANVLICGKSRSGKSTTMREILHQCKTIGIPFVVLEMVKKEYRKLKEYNGLESLRIYSFGNDALKLSINPLRPENGTMIRTHIGNIKNAFCAMSDMESPLPELIQQCMEDAYLKKGWRLNDRAKVSARREYPNMQDLLDSIAPIMERTKYGRSYADIQAALNVRIRNIWNLGLDDIDQPFTEELESVGQLLEHGSIIELDDLDPESRAFVSGMILARLQEYLNSNAYVNAPGVLLILEEAHEIIPAKNQNTSRSLAAASDAFAGFLATSAGLGLSTFVIDQSPSKLNENVIINTGLKMAHCTSYENDILTLKSSMQLSELQAKQLPSLSRGEAIVFDGSYEQPEPYRVQIKTTSEHQAHCSMGCLFCSHAGTPICRTKRICADFISKETIELFERSALTPITIYEAMNCESLRQGKQWDINEQACIAGRLLQSATRLSDGRKSGLIYDTLSLAIERKKVSL